MDNFPNYTEANLQKHLIRNFKKESVLEGKQNYLNAGNVKGAIKALHRAGDLLHVLEQELEIQWHKHHCKRQPYA